MPDATDLRRRFRYHAWATSRLAGVLTDADDHAPARRLLAHALAADRVGLARLRDQPTDGSGHSASPSVREIAGLARDGREAYDEWLAGDPDLAREAVYRNSTGTEYRTRATDVLDHVLLHGAYHRGQTARALRRVGDAPPATDFVVWLRAGEPEA